VDFHTFTVCYRDSFNISFQFMSISLRTEEAKGQLGSEHERRKEHKKQKPRHSYSSSNNRGQRDVLEVIHNKRNKKFWLLNHKQTIPTERPPLVGEF
jgi:hypothetical protein